MLSQARVIELWRSFCVPSEKCEVCSPSLAMPHRCCLSKTCQQGPAREHLSHLCNQMLRTMCFYFGNWRYFHRARSNTEVLWIVSVLSILRRERNLTLTSCPESQLPFCFIMLVHSWGIFCCLQWKHLVVEYCVLWWMRPLDESQEFEGSGMSHMSVLRHCVKCGTMKSLVLTTQGRFIPQKLHE